MRNSIYGLRSTKVRSVDPDRIFHGYAELKRGEKSWNRLDFIFHWIFFKGEKYEKLGRYFRPDCDDRRKKSHQLKGVFSRITNQPTAHHDLASVT